MSKEIEKVNKLIGTGASVSYTIEEKLNKYEVGPSGGRHTIYYKTLEDLEKQITELKKMGFLPN